MSEEPPEREAEEREPEERDYVPGGRRRRRRSPVPGCLAVLVALAILAGGFYVGVTRGISWVSERFNEAAAVDFPGPGSGEVPFEVEEGDSAAQIGRNLKDENVVASVDAFLEVATADPDSASIQVGVYQMREEMRAADALEILLDPANQLRTTVTVPEGLRVTEVVDVLAEGTEFGRRQLQRALEDPELGLPDYAEGNPEGYLFPATYEVTPETTPLALLQQMVSRWRQAADEAGLEDRAAELDKTPAELMIIASLVEAEGRGDDLPRVSRVIFNRLDGPGDKGGTNGLLQVDAANAYGIGESGNVALSEEQLAEDTPYNTRLYPGLPPTPIENPGDAAIEAAANPADGPWYYYVTVDLATGETRFSETYEEFLENRALFQQYCETSDAC